MKIKLVKITDDDNSYKGTWYRKGGIYFVTENTEKCLLEKYNAVDIHGGINEEDCEIIKGFKPWLMCLFKTIGISLYLNNHENQV